jgi:hypothetical protein
MTTSIRTDSGPAPRAVCRTILLFALVALGMVAQGCRSLPMWAHQMIAPQEQEQQNK